MSAEEGKGCDRRMTQSDLRKIQKVAAAMSVAAILFMASSSYLVYYDLLKLHPKSTKVENLKGFSSRLEFTLRYQTLQVFWLVLNVLIVIMGRALFQAVNPMVESTERNVQILKNVLTNSFESIVISVFNQFILLSFAPPDIILKFIPLINIIQFIGRAAFLAGYPLKRFFGFNCTLIPNLAMTIYNLYKFCSFITM